MEFTYNWKHKNYEIRKTKSVSSDNEYWELIKWEEYNSNRTCFTLAYFKGLEEPDLIFVGNRPFEYIEEEDLGIVWDALKMCQQTFTYYNKIQRYL